jgi:hypothetical protein
MISSKSNKESKQAAYARSKEEDRKITVAAIKTENALMVKTNIELHHQINELEIWSMEAEKRLKIFEGISVEEVLNF